LSMTKKEIAALMDDIRSMANKIEQQNQIKVTSKKKRKNSAQWFLIAGLQP
jgi:CHASE3 domain sensor protein